jgi:lipase maturation factor 1
MERLRRFAYRLGFRTIAGWSGEPAPFVISRWLFLRLLGFVYFAAFASLCVQVKGLMGSQGILPAGDFVDGIPKSYGWLRFVYLPTLFWLHAGDVFLGRMCIIGMLLSGLLVLGIAPALVLFILWFSYLSLTVAGQVFMGYQWDALLLEAGFLAIFFAPPQLWPKLRREGPPSLLMLWLYRWLLFRLMFGSGMVKLASGDPTWRDLTALQYHYWTQPLPTWTSWYMQQLPGWFAHLSVLATFFFELIVPFGIFGPRLVRRLACAGLILFQLFIAATGNYGFFNLLSIVLGVPLLDDAFWPRRLTSLASAAASARPARRWPVWILAPVAGFLFLLSIVALVSDFLPLRHWPKSLRDAYFAVASFRSVNSYGLFRVMTTQRREIVIEGSDDFKTWRRYEFRWKPGPVDRRPEFTGPHMPRLDWQMWFAALGDYRQSPWFYPFLRCLAQGSPEVLALLEKNPFPDHPPRFLRAVLYEYRFTDRATRADSGAWWERKRLGLFCPIFVEPQERDNEPALE